jgi:hypothetical protein
MRGVSAATRRTRWVGRVWFGGTMGLLDEAIREHLELKRLHGADPDEVAREERAAFDPVRSDRDVGPEDHLADTEDEISSNNDGEAPEDDDLSDSLDSVVPEAADPREPESRHAIQETAEIDMRTILDAEDLEQDAPASKLDREPSPTHATPPRARRSLLRRRRHRGDEADPLG